VLTEAVLTRLRRLLDDPAEAVVVVPCIGPSSVVARGDRSSVRVTPSQVLRPVVAAGAGSYVLVHTHPDGGPPTWSDLAVTRRLVAASAVLGVQLTAHVVLAPEGEWDCLAP
jgi:DNA repair protein RadC